MRENPSESKFEEFPIRFLPLASEIFKGLAGPGFPKLFAVSLMTREVDVAIFITTAKLNHMDDFVDSSTDGLATDLLLSKVRVEEKDT